MTFHRSVEPRNRQYLEHSISSFRKHRRFLALNHITISMSVSDWLSICLLDLGTDTICRIQEPEKVPSIKLQYDINRRIRKMISWTDKVSNTKSPGSGTRENSKEWITLRYGWAHRNDILFVCWTQEQTRFEALNQLVQETERIPSTKSHYNMDRRVGITFCSSVGLRNSQGFKNSISKLGNWKSFPALDHIEMSTGMSEWPSVRLSDLGTELNDFTNFMGASQWHSVWYIQSCN